MNGFVVSFLTLFKLGLVVAEFCAPHRAAAFVLWYCPVTKQHKAGVHRASHCTPVAIGSVCLTREVTCEFIGCMILALGRLTTNSAYMGILKTFSRLSYSFASSNRSATYATMPTALADIFPVLHHSLRGSSKRSWSDFDQSFRASSTNSRSVIDRLHRPHVLSDRKNSIHWAASDREKGLLNTSSVKVRPQPRCLCMAPTSTVGINANAVGEDRDVAYASDIGGREAFLAVFHRLREDLLSDVDDMFDIPRTARDFIAHNINYNVPHGKLTRGLAVHRCYVAFRGGEPSEQESFLAHVLGWCVEWLQAFFLVADDIMDDSVTRRGQPCFFRLPGIGLNAVNDALILELMIYRLLKKHFRDHPSYLALIELFHEITYVTEVGQLLDLTLQNNDGVVDLSLFTVETLNRIYRYKTSHYSFYLPVALGMRLAHVTEESKYSVAKSICLELGEYFQAQDDYIDAFGDPNVTGKVGTDIEDNKCTWLVVEALKRASDSDRAVLTSNYAKKDPVAVNAVKDLYRRLGVPQAFADYEQASYSRIKAMIADVNDMPTGAFEFLLRKIYKRHK